MSEQTKFEQVKQQYLSMKDNGASWSEMDRFLGNIPESNKKSLIQRLSRAGIYVPKPKSSGGKIGRPPVKPGLIARIVSLNPDLESERLSRMTITQLENIIEMLDHKVEN